MANWRTWQLEETYLIRFSKRNSTFSGTIAFLLAVIFKTAPSVSIRCNTLAMFFVSSMPRWWLPNKGIFSSFIIVRIPAACNRYKQEQGLMLRKYRQREKNWTENALWETLINLRIWCYFVARSNWTLT